MGFEIEVLGDSLMAFNICYAIKFGNVPNKDNTKTILEEGVNYFNLAIKYCAFLGSKKVKLESIDTHDAARIYGEIISIKPKFLRLDVEQFVDELNKYKFSLEKLVNNEVIDQNSKKELLYYFDKLRTIYNKGGSGCFGLVA
mgnify:CR=1 FL=1